MMMLLLLMAMMKADWMNACVHHGAMDRPAYRGSSVWG